MKKSERERLLALALGGELDETGKARFEALLSSDEIFRAEWERMRQVGDLVSETRAERFDPFFSTRVMARLRGEHSEAGSFADGLMRVFRPLVPVTLGAAVFLAVLNWRDRDLMSEGSSFIEITFAVPPVSVETAEIMEM